MVGHHCNVGASVASHRRWPKLRLWSVLWSCRVGGGVGSWLVVGDGGREGEDGSLAELS